MSSRNRLENERGKFLFVLEGTEGAENWARQKKEGERKGDRQTDRYWRQTVSYRIPTQGQRWTDILSASLQGGTPVPLSIELCYSQPRVVQKL